MGERWRALSPEEKKRFEDMANNDKKRFNDEMQAYTAQKAERDAQARDVAQAKFDADVDVADQPLAYSHHHPGAPYEHPPPHHYPDEQYYQGHLYDPNVQSYDHYAQQGGYPQQYAHHGQYQYT